MKLSIVTPVHDIPEKGPFLARLKRSLDAQTFRDFEWVQVHTGKMAANTNQGIRLAEGEIIKILFMDDYLAHENALQNIVDGFTGGWMATGCLHDNGVLHNPHDPVWPGDLLKGVNLIGSPSVIAFERENGTPALFDENLSWLLDCDLYHRLGIRYGPPRLLYDYNVVIGLGPHQTTHTMPDEDKRKEYTYLAHKYQ